MICHPLLESIIEKYSEWLEMSDDPDILLINILTHLLAQEQESKKYYKTLFDSLSKS